MVYLKDKSNILVCSFLMLFIFGSCTDNFIDINTPDDEIVTDDVGAGELGQAFAQAQHRGNMGESPSGNIGGFQLIHSLYTDIYAQYFATTAKNFDSDQYVEVGSWVDGGWDHFYDGAAPQLDFVISFTAENDMEVEHAVANIYKVQFYQQITDLWGPIIYSEFGNGETSVAYDTQESIYKDFFEILGNARNTLLNTSRTAAFSQNDLIFEGDLNRWLKFANSLQLRAAMRIRFVDPQKAQEKAEEAVDPANGGIMTSNADNATITTTENNKNTYSTITDWGEYRMSATMESFMVGYNDPRVSEYFNPIEKGQGGPYKGLRNGIPKGDKDQAFLNSHFSDMNTKYFSQNRGGSNPDLRVMDAAEVYFLRAEGALLGWDMGGGTAQSYYEDGIRASLKDRTNATDTEITDYITSSATPKEPEGVEGANVYYNLPAVSNIPVAFKTGGSDEEKMEQIITQKWISLYPNSFEAYAEFRRTGYPKQYERVNSLNADVSTTEIFRRLTFVTSEKSNNKEAYNAAQELLDGPPENNATRVWWDAKPLSEYPDFVSP